MHGSGAQWIVSGSSFDGVSGLGSPLFKLKARSGNVSVDQCPLDMLGEHVGWVFCAKDFAEEEILGSEAVLDPEVGNGQVPHLPQAPSTAYADCCSGIRMKPQSPVETEISGNGLHTESQGSAFADSGEFCLRGTEGDHTLSRAPVF